jgi:hypothetical protein
MSTRCAIHFTYGGAVHANVYRHTDGYPDGSGGILADLDSLFSDVEGQCGWDTRFSDPTYLAAKFVVWQAGKYAWRLNPRTFVREPAPLLAFLGVGVQVEDPSDISYRYRVECDAPSGRPEVAWQYPSENVWHSGPERETESANV